MTLKHDVIQETLRLGPDMAAVKDRLEEEPERMFACMFPERDPGLHLGGAIGDQEGPEPPETQALKSAITQRRERLLEAGRRGLEKVERHGEDADLDREEVTGLEAIILLTARPAIRVVSGRFLPPPPPWEMLENARNHIEQAARSVGRIQLEGNPLLPYAGTGFIVGAGVIMTNRHVAQVFAVSDGGEWIFQSGISASIDYADDPDREQAPKFAVTRVLAVHSQFDLALLEITGREEARLPEPLTLASESPDDPVQRRRVYALGYPAFDPRNDAGAMHQVFGDVYNVKRLQPGEMMAFLKDESIFHHDCSTLGGNSGSCVIDLDTHLVLGLHFSGKYLEYNRAVAVWRLRDDPLLGRTGVNFE